MPSITTENDITFCYTDSGPPSNDNYQTVIILNGLAFHNGIFNRVASLAGSRKMRIIAFNRRGYPGTTPYMPNERQAVLNGSFDERKAFLQEQGSLIALAVVRLIQQLSLPGNVTLAGWSVGISFLLAVFCSLNELPRGVQQTLKDNVRAFVILDPGTYPLGISLAEDNTHFVDDNISLEKTILEFHKWSTIYYPHPELSSRNILMLLPFHPSLDTFQNRTLFTSEELSSIHVYHEDLSLERKVVTPAFAPVLAAQLNTLLYDCDIREAWDRPNIWCLYGDASVWPCLYGKWYIEDRMLESNKINFECMSGANHFFMWDDPERTIYFLKKIWTDDV